MLEHAPATVVPWAHIAVPATLAPLTSTANCYAQRLMPKNRETGAPPLQKGLSLSLFLSLSLSFSLSLSLSLSLSYSLSLLQCTRQTTTDRHHPDFLRGGAHIFFIAGETLVGSGPLFYATRKKPPLAATQAFSLRTHAAPIFSNIQRLPSFQWRTVPVRAAPFRTQSTS